MEGNDMKEALPSGAQANNIGREKKVVTLSSTNFNPRSGIYDRITMFGTRHIHEKL